MNKISFLLGAGFSIPSNFPDGKKLSEKIKSANDETLASFGARKELIKFYREFITFFLSETNVFHFEYEKFYDFYYKYKKSWIGKNEIKIENFCNDFLKNNTHTGVSSADNLIYRFDELFQRVIEHELIGPLDANSDFSKYELFFNWIKSRISNTVFRIHTLNHDLLFEYLIENFELCEKFSDGYTKMNSDYLGEVIQSNKKEEKVLKYFNEDYAKSICFYKLHGSIDQCIYSMASDSQDLTRIKRPFKCHGFKKKGDSNFKYAEHMPYPEFLTGSISKKYDYDNLVDSYFPRLFKLFKENLFGGDKLVVIGYSFRDIFINQFIEDNFLIHRNSRLKIIDPFPSEEAVKLKNSYPNQITILQKNIENIAWNRLFVKKKSKLKGELLGKIFG